MSDFEIAIEKTLNCEGGYCNNSSDPGGETKFGISKRSYPDVDIKNLTIEQAKDIYKKDFWDTSGIGLINSQKIAEQIFDLAVNIGPSNAIRILQRSCNFLILCTVDFDASKRTLLAVDGKMGAKTLDASNSFETNSETALLLIVIERIAAEYYNKLKKPLFTNGWLNRLFENADLESV